MGNDGNCDICEDKPATCKCDKCKRKTCEECGRTIRTQIQSGLELNRTKEIWECLSCEFGTPMHEE
jgi:hypothetical protein